MTSLTKKLTVLKQRKSSTKKNYTKTSETLRLAKLLYKKSVSGTNSIQHKIDNFRSELEGISTVLQQNFAQRDSITSLIEQAENRLSSEKEKYDEIKEEVSFASGEAKKQLEFTINTVSTEIEDLHSQLKSRKKTLEKVIQSIQEYDTKKSKLNKQIKKTLESKPRLMKAIQQSKKTVAELEKKIPSLIQAEKNVHKNFSKINSIIKEQISKKKEIQVNIRKKKAREAKRKSVEDKRILSMARKLANKILAEKKKAPKRKASKKKAPKRKASKKKAPKRKASKKKAPKRKASKKNKK
jgi:hypothetical protein